MKISSKFFIERIWGIASVVMLLKMFLLFLFYAERIFLVKVTFLF
jgi:hypothetical protein